MQVDRPSGASSYVCPHPGGYKVQHGQLRPFPQAAAGPIMLVSATNAVMAPCLCKSCLIITRSVLSLELTYSRIEQCDLVAMTWHERSL